MCIWTLDENLTKIGPSKLELHASKFLRLCNGQGNETVKFDIFGEPLKYVPLYDNFAKIGQSKR